MSLLDFTKHVPKFGGEIWYVSGVKGNDGYGGTEPDTAFATIGKAIAEAIEGDAINVMAATYTETGLDMNKDSLELWCEIGTLIDPPSGTALTVSGNSCRITGTHKITPDSTEIGLLVTGNECHIEYGKVLGGTSGVRVTGSGAIVNNYACGFQVNIGFDIQGAQGRFAICSTVGNTTSIGYKINNSVDTGTLRQCTSSGHQTSGYYIDTGSVDWTILHCSSGGGDGRSTDVDSANVWSDFVFDDHIFHLTTFTGTGAGSSNLFKVTGSVLITQFHGDVETALAADVGTGYLELYDGTNTVDMTDSPGPSFASLPVGTYLHKIDDASIQIAIEDSSQIRLYEDATKDGRDPDFQITGKEGATNYIRLTWSGNAASGAIHWHCQWEPLTENGFLEAV